VVNNDNFLLKEIPKFNPIIQRWERLNFWKSVKQKIFEGEWVGGRWCPPELYFHVNLSTIQFLGGGRKVQGIGQPWFRDIEWEKAFIYSEACGFSGFIDDPVYTCLRNVQTETKDEIYRDFCLDNKGVRIEKNYKALFTSTGELKKYWDARTYFWRTDMANSYGKALYLNNAKNVLEMGGRGYGKSYFTSSCIQHNLLTDGGRDYDEYLIGRKEGKMVSISQTLVGAIEAKYSGDLMNKVKFSLEHLPGAIDIRLNGEDKSFPSPLMPEIGGSWEPGAKNPIHDMLSGSSLIHRTFQDNPLAANGTRPTRCFLEEIGFFATIQEVLGAVEATQPNRQSNKYLPIYMLGTGGYTTTGTAVWLKQIFNDPESYDCLSFDDEWENKGKIGYFVPSTKGLNDFKEGPNLIANIPRATKIIEDSREKARKSNNKIKILTTIINQPLTPSEVFMTIDGNFFPVEDLRECLHKLESNPTIFNQSYKYEMIMVDGKVFPKLSDKQVIREFPIKKGINMDAPIEVYELPKKNGNGDIPYGRYLASWDPIDVDGNEDTSQSLQSIFIMDSWTDRLVAEYTSRTYLASEYYEQARRLFIYYNALCNYESNLKGPYAHFLNKNSLHLFCDTPEILSDKSIGGKGGVGNKSKGTRVGGNASGSPIINYGVNEILSWIESPAYDKPEGTRVMDTLQGPQLLRELISYSPQLNCDRISSLILLMIIRADRKRITDVSKTQSIKTKASDPLWSRPFGGNHRNLYGGYAQADLNKLR
jgi:hypothetical protein